jgi:hypothetical protein
MSLASGGAANDPAAIINVFAPDAQRNRCGRLKDMHTNFISGAPGGGGKHQADEVPACPLIRAMHRLQLRGLFGVFFRDPLRQERDLFGQDLNGARKISLHFCAMACQNWPQKPLDHT